MLFCYPLNVCHLYIATLAFAKVHDHSYLGAAELPGGDAAQACRTNRISAPPRHRLAPMAQLSLGAA